MRLFYKVLPLWLCITIFSTKESIATIHVIQVGLNGDLSFSPSGLSIPLGDTVRFQWVSGSHTTTSTSVPGGGVAWNQNITSGSTTYTYKPAVIGTYNYRCTPHFAMGMIGSFTVTSPLPLRIVSFMASPTYHGALLEWKISQDDGADYDYFEIERSINGADFITINQIKVSSKSTEKYQYTDEKWEPSMNYYRLKTVDKKGMAAYSTIISINNNLTTDKHIHLMENPVSENLPLHVIETKSELNIQIIDMSGKILQSKTIAKGFSGMINMDMGAIAAGQYILQVKGTGKNETTKFTKQ